MDGSVSMECDAITGECTCKNTKIKGVNCEKCDDERYGYPDCHRNYFTQYYIKISHKNWYIIPIISSLQLVLAKQKAQ